MSIAVEAALAGDVVVWGAPTYKQINVAWKEMYHAAGSIANFHKSDREVSFPQGGAVIFRTMDDPDNARGLTADGAIFDEVADIKPDAYYEVVRPMLIDTQGWFWGLGTPKGRNWFFGESVAAMDRGDSKAWQVPTLGVRSVDGTLVREPHPMENPEIPFAEMEHLYGTLPERAFRQEILAEFIEGEGAVFRNIPACLGAEFNTTVRNHENHRFVIGVDWGKQQDFTAISIGCATCRVELELDRFNQIDYVFQRGRLAVLRDRWLNPPVLPERNSVGIPVIEQLTREGFRVMPGPDGELGFNTSATTKPQLIENLALVFEKEEWQFLDVPIATAELEAYERKVSPTTGRPQYSAPEGLHDDTVIARALMVWAGGRASELVEQPRQAKKWRQEDWTGSRWKRF